VLKSNKVATSATGNLGAGKTPEWAGATPLLHTIPCPKVNHGSLQPNRKFPPVRGENLGKGGEEGRNYVLQLRLHHLLHLVMCLSFGKTRK
jgi:hypothetical protein